MKRLKTEPAASRLVIFNFGAIGSANRFVSHWFLKQFPPEPRAGCGLDDFRSNGPPPHLPASTGRQCGGIPSLPSRAMPPPLSATKAHAVELPVRKFLQLLDAPFKRVDLSHHLCPCGPGLRSALRLELIPRLHPSEHVCN